MKIGILGGTFDPVHKGHLEIAQKAKEQFSLSKVIFIPALIPPHKLERRDIAPAPYRLKMVQLAVLEDPAFEVSDMELNRADISYTVDTLQALKTLHPNDEFYLIVGADSLEGMPQWREPEKIAQMAQVAVAPRRKFVFPGNMNMKMLWIDMPLYDYSSSEIREKIRSGKSIRGMVPPAVENYIVDKKLYLKG